MSNHIAAKFIGIEYSRIPKEQFVKQLSELAERLRGKLPRYETPSVNQIALNFDGGTIATNPQESGKELHLVDAVGNFGVKVGNSGLSVSCAEYVRYEELLEFFNWVTDEVSDCLKVTHFSRLSLKNVNLFKEKEGKANHFDDIRDANYWGRQQFKTLNNEFLCSGAATRHEYLSDDYLKHIVVSSGVVLPVHNQSYIPQSEWDIWKLRGAIPTLDEVRLLIDISATGFVSPANKPELQNNVIEFDWDVVKQKIDELHDLMNSVYFDIVEND